MFLKYEMVNLEQGSQAGGSEPASSGNLLEMQSIRPLPKPTESEVPGWAPAIRVLKALGDPLPCSCMVKFENHRLRAQENSPGLYLVG